jgi:hypothetical protein
MRKAKRILKGYVTAALFIFLLVCFAGTSMGRALAGEDANIMGPLTWRDIAFVLGVYCLILGIWKIVRRISATLWGGYCHMTAPDSPIVRFGNGLIKTRVVRWWNKIVG